MNLSRVIEHVKALDRGFFELAEGERMRILRFNKRLQAAVRIMIVVSAGAALTACAEPGAPAAAEGDHAEMVDSAAVSPEFYSVLFENEHLRVVEYALPPGARDNPHTHPPKFMYVLNGGKLKITPDKGAPFTSEEGAGHSAWSPARGLHTAENIGETTMRILLIEPKSAQGSNER